MNRDRNSDIVVVLDRPQDVVNIGAVVRAIKNMGFSQLRLVNPRPFDPQELARFAHHAEDVIAAIRVYATLDEALADAVYVVGTSAIAHAARPLRRDIEPLSQELRQKALTGPVVLLFGTEDDGLDTMALDRCHVVAALPTNPAYPALNLAQSVLLFLYELSRPTPSLVPAQSVPTAPEISALAPPRRTHRTGTQHRPTPLMPQGQLEQMFTLGEQALAAIGFFKYNPQTVMRTLRQLAYRAELQPQEAALLMAIARQALYVAEQPTTRAGPAPAVHKTKGRRPRTPALVLSSTRTGIRTPVAALKGRFLSGYATCLHWGFSLGQAVPRPNVRSLGTSGRDQACPNVPHVGQERSASSFRRPVSQLPAE